MRISKKQFYLVDGLLVAAKEKYAEAHQLLDMAAKELKQKPDRDDSWPYYYGHLSDALFSDYSTKELLAKLKITVR